MKKKKVFTVLAVMAGIVVFGAVLAYAYGESFFEKWGEYTSSKTSQNSGSISVLTKEYRESFDMAISEDEIYFIGNDIIITVADVNQAIEFYKLAGYDEQTASDMGIDYVKKYNACFVEALKNGCSVSDAEIKSKIESLKQMYEEAENKEEIEAVIKKYPSEDAYWEYEYGVYQKSLPIEKYRETLENNYKESSSSDYGTEEFQNEWLEWYDNYQKQLSDGQNFLLWSDLTDAQKNEALKNFAL